jgi:hypothetical protein
MGHPSHGGLVMGAAGTGCPQGVACRNPERMLWNVKSSVSQGSDPKFPQSKQGGTQIGIVRSLTIFRPMQFG